MKKFALIGEKLGHSYSAIIHRRFFELAGLDCSYDLAEIPLGGFESRFLQLAEAYSGINVTIPYKQTVTAYLDGESDISRKIGAVNTVSFSDGKAIGDNTDYYGLKMTLDKNSISLKGKRAVILGTGGASKAVCALCEDGGASDITFVSRSADKNMNHRVIDYSSEIKGDILFNTTPSGMYPNMDSSPLDEVDCGFEFLMDLIYNPSETLLMKKAKASGVKAVNGLYMLVSQALFSQSIWQGIPFDAKAADTIYTELSKKFERGAEK